EPIFEADLEPEQYAYRANRTALDAVRQVHGLVNSGHTEVIDADLSGYFDSIPHAELLKSLSRRISDRHLLALIKVWLETPVEEIDERGRHHRTTRNKDEGPHKGLLFPRCWLTFICVDLSADGRPWGTNADSRR